MNSTLFIPKPLRKQICKYFPKAERNCSRDCYDHAPEIHKAVEIVRNWTMTSFQKLATLYQQVLHADETGLPGAFVECGVWKGGSVGLMALAHQRRRSAHRELHLFDSFEGLPEPDAVHDGEEAVQYSHNRGDGRCITTGNCAGTLQENRHLLEEVIKYPSSLIRYHQGWFQDTVPKDAGDLPPIAVLRLDGDWYESTKICLEHLYDKVVPGGFVIFDDYGTWVGCKKATDEFLASLPSKPFLIHIDDSGRYLIK